MAQMNISVPDGLKNWADQRVADGRYASTSDYVRDLMRRDQEKSVQLAWLQTEIDKGRASPVIDRDASEVLKEIMARNRAARA
ncbi:type II toxin-antitoxin system ParD family antitoxin [soil metagenome]